MITHMTLWDAVRASEDLVVDAIHTCVVNGLAIIGKDICRLEWANSAAKIEEERVAA